MIAIDAAARRITAVMATAAQTPWSTRISSRTFFLGQLAGLRLTAQIHEWWTSSLNLCSSSPAGQIESTQPDLVLAFTLYPVTAPGAQLAVLAVAVAALVGFYFGASERPRPHSFGAWLRATASS